MHLQKYSNTIEFMGIMWEKLELLFIYSILMGYLRCSNKKKLNNRNSNNSNESRNSWLSKATPSKNASYLELERANVCIDKPFWVKMNLNRILISIK